MVEKTLNTRVVLKHDTLANWNNDSAIILKEGEVALAKVEVNKVDPISGELVKVPTYLIKVGDGTSKFSALNWVAAPASDVYDWAKKTETEFTTWIKTLVTVDDINLENYYTKEETYNLVSDATAKLANIAEGATKVEASTVNGSIKINGEETVVYTHPDKHTSVDISDFADAVKVVKVNEAVKATNDGAGNEIATTYATKAEAEGYANAKDEAIAAAKKAGDDAQAGVDTLVGDVVGDDAMSVREIANEVTNSGIGSLALSVEKRTVEDVDKDYIVLRAGAGEAKVEIASLDATTFVKDGMLNSVVLNDDNDLVLTFNTDADKEKITIPLDELIDVYTAGTGIDITGNVVLLNEDSQAKLNMAHSHANKNVLDDITADKVTAWDGAVADKDKYIAADTALKAELIGTEGTDNTAEISIYGARAFASDAAITATAEANEYTDGEIGKLLADGGQVKINADAIDAINDEENGILAQAKAYANGLPHEDTKYTAAADGGLKLDPTNNAFSIDETVTFILDCGGSGVTA